MRHSSETTRILNIIIVGCISAFIGLIILTLKHFYISSADHYYFLSAIMLLGFSPSLLYRLFPPRFASYILVGNALLLVSLVFSLMAKWLLCGVFILVPVFSLLFKNKLLYIITSVCSLLVNMVLIMLFLFESTNQTEHIINILDILVIYLIVVFLIYFISSDLVKQSQLETKHMQTILTLSKSVEAKDPYTRGHSDRVAHIAQMIADKLQLISSKDIYYSGLIHDVGKLTIPDMILTKAGPLTDDEYNLMKAHTTEGANICASLEINEDIIKGVLHHHERWDGRGYPHGLKGEQIPLIGRILCAADTIDAMSSDRAYRDSLDLEWIYNELIKCSATQFDPKIIDVIVNQWTQIKDYIIKSKQHV